MILAVILIFLGLVICLEEIRLDDLRWQLKTKNEVIDHARLLILDYQDQDKKSQQIIQNLKAGYQEDLDYIEAELDRAWRYNLELQHRLRDRVLYWDIDTIGYKPTIWRN